MTHTEPPEPIRIPIAHSVRYVARGLPDVPYQYGRGVLRPSEITLTYRTAPDSQLGGVHAYVAGRIHVDGQEIPHAAYGQHYYDGLDNWPEWLTEEARLHDPAPAVSAGVAPATDHAAGVAEAIRAFPFDNFGMDDVSFALEDNPEAQEWVPALAAAVLAALFADRGQADVMDDEGDELVCVDECGSCDACGMEVFGTPAEGWREAARFLRRTARQSTDRQGALHGARLIEAELRRVAAEPAT